MYELDGSIIIKETWGNNQLVPMYDITGSVLGILYNNTPYYFMRNLQGDVIGVVNNSGTLVAEYSYDAWGKCSIVGDTSGVDIANVNPFRYRGYYYDSEIGLYYCNARYYDAEVGRWISADIVSYLDPSRVNGINLFCYCCNNPIMYLDPNGHIAFWLLAGIIVGAIGLVCGGVYAGTKSYDAGHRGWELVGDVALGAVVGGAIGFAIGALFGATASGALTGSFATTVKEVFAGLARVYQMAKYGGGAAAGYMMLDNLYNSFKPAQHIFWSGGDIAMNKALNYAQTSGGITLEMTRLGGYLSTNFSGGFSNPILWDIASKNFAYQVGYGEMVRAILYYPGMRESAIWFTEKVVLLERLANIIIGG